MAGARPRVSVARAGARACGIPVPRRGGRYDLQVEGGSPAMLVVE